MEIVVIALRINSLDSFFNSIFRWLANFLIRHLFKICIITSSIISGVDIFIYWWKKIMIDCKSHDSKVCQMNPFITTEVLRTQFSIFLKQLWCISTMIKPKNPRSLAWILRKIGHIIYILKCHNRIKNTNRQNIAKRQNILTMKQILNFKSKHFLQCRKNNCYLVRFLKKTLIRNAVKGLKLKTLYMLLHISMFLYMLFIQALF